MRDYSLHSVASRPATGGDELVTTTFNGTSTRGLSAIGAPDVAVCVLPGTEIVFAREAELDHPFARLVPWLHFATVAERGLLSVAGRRQVNFAPRRTGAPRSDRAPVKQGPTDQATDPSAGKVGEPGAGHRADDRQAKIAP
jgi:hypothetical protein